MGSLSRYYSPPDLSVTGSDYNIVAPYAANYRLESFNSVSYTNFDTFSNTSNETVRVSKFIRDQTGVNFYGIKMMVAEWTNVSLSYSSDVGLYILTVFDLLFHVCFYSPQPTVSKAF